MTKQEIRRELTHNDDDLGVVTLTRISEWLGQKNKCRVRQKYLQGIPRIGTGYPVKDVVDRIYQMQR